MTANMTTGLPALGDDDLGAGVDGQFRVPGAADLMDDTNAFADQVPHQGGVHVPEKHHERHLKSQAGSHLLMELGVLGGDGNQIDRERLVGEPA